MARNIILLLILFANFSYTQDYSKIQLQTEKLRKKVHNSQGSERLYNYISLFDYLKLNQPNKAILEKDTVLQLATKLNDNEALIKIYLILGVCYFEIHKNDIALEYFEKGLKLAKNERDSSKIAEAMIKIGKVKIMLGELDIALKNFEVALEISQRTRDTRLEISATNYLGILNYIIDNISEAEKLTFKAFELAQKHNDLEGLGLANEHLAIIRIKQVRYEEALKYNKNAEDISFQLDFIANIPAVYYNYGVIYNRMGNYNKALEYINKSQEIRKTFEDIRGLATDYNMLGRVFMAKKEYKKAIENFEMAQKIYKEYNALRSLVPVLYSLAISYENVGNFKAALNYFKEYKTFSDSMFNENVKRQVAISNAKRQLEEKELEIKKLEEKALLQTKLQNFLIIFTSITLIVLAIAVSLYFKVRKSRHEILEINKKLVSLNNERNKFFSIISHDLKSPFLGILGLTELLKDEANQSDNQTLKNLTYKLDKAVNNQYKLVDNLLNWTLLQSGKMKFEPSEFVLTDVVNEVIESLNNFSAQKNIRIKSSFEKSFTVFADRNMISSVLRNLISNAIKYSLPDSDVNVTVSKKNENYITVKVKDSGVGISEENISKLFSLDYNFSTEGTDNEKGTGLGLLIVKDMVTQNKGEISVTSKPNLGSIFEFTLPIARH
jgi:signal transduction histidine kinase